jgi:outer membrane scaffolding protein for murein synthesis (MipA/OmpV family)
MVDWKGEQWTILINTLVSTLMKFGSQAVRVGSGVRCRGARFRLALCLHLSVFRMKPCTKFVVLLMLPMTINVAHAQVGMGSDLIPNLIGIGIGSTTRYSGANDSVTLGAPGFRYQFKNSNRYVDWFGPIGTVNLLESSSWQLGPALNVRGGRHDARDAAVAKLGEIDATVEGGLLASYTYTNFSGLPYRLRLGAIVLADLGDRYSGSNTSLFASFWAPASSNVLLGAGVAASLVSSSFNRTYYGVDAVGATTSGLPVYTPGGGLRQWSLWQAVIVRLNKEWAIGGGVFYQRLVKDAADSPIVRQHGDQNQWTFGAGIAYTWD